MRQGLSPALPNAFLQTIETSLSQAGVKLRGKDNNGENLLQKRITLFSLVVKKAHT
jgi:hypothetical protein